MRTVMSNQWNCLRGIEVVAITFSALNITAYDGKILAEVQQAAALQNPLLQTAHPVGVQADAVKNAAYNNTGIGIVLTANGEKITNIEDNGATYTWTCDCGTVTTTKFCPECEKSRCGV